LAALISLLVIVTLSLLITRIATIALVYTGLSREAARFQARSAFTGVGFTTNESEMVVQHPVRRRILMWLMLLGNVGFVTAISSLLLTFIGSGEGAQGWVLRLLLLILGLLILWVFMSSRWADRMLSRFIKEALHRWTRLDVRDYFSLLHLSGEYRVMELTVDPEDWLANRELRELGLRQEGLVVLGIRRQRGRYVGAPKGKTRIRPHDTLILYGRMPLLNELEQRRSGPAGEAAHQQAVKTQEQVLVEQDRQDRVDGS